MMKRSAQVVACVLCAWSAREAISAPYTEEQLLGLASRSVVQLVVEREREPGRPPPPGREREYSSGSAVVVADRLVDGERRLVLATAYHVPCRADRIVVNRHDGRPIAVIEPGSAALCYVDRGRELAFLEVSPNADGAGLAAVDLENLVSVPRPDGEPRPIEAGRAFGYPRFRSVPIESRRIDLLGILTAGGLGLVRKGGDATPAQLNAADARFRLLGDQATLEGMSGGLAVDLEGRFAGLIYGRRIDQFNLSIPSQVVEQLWLRAAMDRTGWIGFADRPFRDPSLFEGGDDTGGMIENLMDWGTAEGVSILLGDDPLGALDRFLEIVVAPPLRQEPPDLEMLISISETLPNPKKHKLGIWINGKPQDVPGLFDPPVTFPMSRLPGETMVTLVKSCGRPDDYEIGQLVSPSRVDLTFRYKGEAPFLHVVRSLPAITHAYPLFLTILNDPGVVPGVKAGRKPANARLALRLDYAEAVLNQSPFSIEVQKTNPIEAPNAGEILPADRAAAPPKDPRSPDVSYDGVFKLDATRAWELRRLSLQRLGLTLNGDAILVDAIRYGGLTLDPRPVVPMAKASTRLSVSGRFQFPYEMPEPAAMPPGRGGEARRGLFISPRVTGAKHDPSGADELRVDVRDGLEADIAPIIRHLLALYVNARLLGENHPHWIEYDKIAPFLERLGLAAKQGWQAEARKMVFQYDKLRKQSWLILTLRLDPVAADGAPAPVQPAAAGMPADLLAAPEFDDAPSRVILLEAWGVPGAVAAHFPGMASANPVIAALAEEVVKELRLTVDLKETPEQSFEGLEPGEELFFFRSNGNDVADRILKALSHSIGRSESRMRIALGPHYARETLRAALGRPDLVFDEDPNGASFLVRASRGAAGSHASAALIGGPLVLRTPAGANVDLGDGVRLRDARLELESLEAEGDLDAAEFRSRTAGKLSLDSLGSGGLSCSKLSGRISMTVLSRPDRPQFAAGEVDSVRGTALLFGVPIPFQVGGKIPFKVDRGLFVDAELDALIDILQGR
ncbi:S1 family peptidase [Paludisphaera mucosa]|uniref:Serine protease n=1 Tax=Paludisphaera mucosa TaxID=3030827 RepID=A0ABT6F4A6_9BACT|nr:serine protease [Paludisphaera mucosa]MDG3002422.1 serine protease [Paludisphaera mucosa]